MWGCLNLTIQYLAGILIQLSVVPPQVLTLDPRQLKERKNLDKLKMAVNTLNNTILAFTEEKNN